MIRLILLALVAVGALAQRTAKVEIFDTSGRPRIRIDSASGYVTYDTGGVQRSSLTETFVEIRGGTATGSRLAQNGVYLRDNAGNQNAYIVSAERSLSAGGGFEFTTSTGASKFLMNTGNSDAPDSLNGYKVNGTSAIDSARNAYMSTYLQVGPGTPGVGTHTEVGSADILLLDTSRTRVNIAGGGTSGAGIVRTFNTAGTTMQNEMTSGGFDTAIGYKVAGSVLSDASRNLTTGTITAAGATIGITAAGFNTTTGAYFTNSIQRISAAGNGAFADLSTTGTSNLASTVNIGSGTSGTVTVGSGTIRAEHGATTSSWYSGSILRGSVSNAGSFQSFNSGGTLRSEMTNSGFNTTQNYFANGTAGLSATISVRNSAGTGTCTITVNMGLVTATTC